MERQTTETIISNDAGAGIRAPASRLERLRGRRQLLADGALLAVTLIWGATFVMVKDAVSAFPVFSFMAVRFTLAALALLPFVMWQARRSLRDGTEIRRINPITAVRVLFPSALIGFALFAGYAFQTAGLQLTTPAKAGFITGLAVVMVPVASALLLRHSPSRNAWIGVILATLGLALLSLTADLSFSTGDALLLGCAVSFAAHLLLLAHFAPKHNPLLLTMGQVVAVALFSAAAALFFDPRMLLTEQTLFAAAFTGVLATAVAFAVMTVAQRFTSSTHTALICSAEPVFAGVFSWLLIGEVLGPRQLLGCALILGGMLVAELKRG